MGDTGDDFRAWKDHNREQRQKYGQPCEGCTINEPKRNAKILFPGQKCRYCGHKDPRKRRGPDEG